MSVGAIVGALAPTFGVLLAGRMLQGAGAAAIPTLGVAIISARYGGVNRAIALGRVAGTAAAISCLGPLVGGVVADLLGWRTVIALPMLGMLLVPLLWRSLPTEGSGARLDLWGAVLVAATSAGLVMLVQSPSTGPSVAVAGRAAAGARHPRRRLVGAQAAGRLPAGLGAAQRRGGAQLRRGGGHPGGVVRAADRGAGGAGRRRAGSRGRSGWCCCRAPPPALLSPRVAGPLLARIGGTSSLALSGLVAAASLGIAALGASAHSATLLVAAVVGVTLAFGLGQPALMAVVGDAVTADVRGVALGLATLMFLVGGGVGSAVVGGFGPVIGMGGSLLLLALLPLLGLAALVRELRTAAEPAD